VASTRATFTLDDELASQARNLNINVSAAAQDGVARAVAAALAAADRLAYKQHPEVLDPLWVEAEAWGEV
jgi:hydroxyethylthiazole kinase-like sugar kinase family protein